MFRLEVLRTLHRPGPQASSSAGSLLLQGISHPRAPHSPSQLREERQSGRVRGSVPFREHPLPLRSRAHMPPPRHRTTAAWAGAPPSVHRLHLWACRVPGPPVGHCHGRGRSQSATCCIPHVPTLPRRRLHQPQTPVPGYCPPQEERWAPGVPAARPALSGTSGSAGSGPAAGG